MAIPNLKWKREFSLKLSSFSPVYPGCTFFSITCDECLMTCHYGGIHFHWAALKCVVQTQHPSPWPWGHRVVGVWTLIKLAHACDWVLPRHKSHFPKPTRQVWKLQPLRGGHALTVTQTWRCSFLEGAHCFRGQWCGSLGYIQVACSQRPVILMKGTRHKGQVTQGHGQIPPRAREKLGHPLQTCELILGSEQLKFTPKYPWDRKNECSLQTSLMSKPKVRQDYFKLFLMPPKRDLHMWIMLPCKSAISYAQALVFPVWPHGPLGRASIAAKPTNYKKGFSFTERVELPQRFCCLPPMTLTMRFK